MKRILALLAAGLLGFALFGCGQTSPPPAGDEYLPSSPSAPEQCDPEGDLPSEDQTDPSEDQTEPSEGQTEPSEDDPEKPAPPAEPSDPDEKGPDQKEPEGDPSEKTDPDPADPSEGEDPEKEPEAEDLFAFIEREEGLVITGWKTPCDALKIPAAIGGKKVYAIDDGAFEFCAAASLVIEEGVAKIGGNAFYGAAALENISLPASLREIGEDAFAETAFLKAQRAGEPVYLDGCLISANGFAGKELSVRAGTRLIAAGGCARLVSLERVLLPKSLLAVGGSAFSGCSLSSVLFEDPLGWRSQEGPIDLNDPAANAERLCARNAPALFKQTL